MVLFAWEGGDAFMGWGIKGLESYHKQIEKLDKIADDLGKATSVDLLTTEFMKTYTNFSSFTELLDNGGYTINSNEDFQNILGDEFDIYIFLK
jgi:hypothetical protein